jgi:hypothetical protein
MADVDDVPCPSHSIRLSRGNDPLEEVVVMHAYIIPARRDLPVSLAETSTGSASCDRVTMCSVPR